jgi:hypothetical protein
MQRSWDLPMTVERELRLPSGDSGAGLIRFSEERRMVWSGTAVHYRRAAHRWPRQLSWTPPTVSLRKEVIQPQVLLRLPCYDFTPIMEHTLGRCPPCGSACRLLVQSTFVM